MNFNSLHDYSFDGQNIGDLAEQLLREERNVPETTSFFSRFFAPARKQPSQQTKEYINNLLKIYSGKQSPEFHALIRQIYHKIKTPDASFPIPKPLKDGEEEKCRVLKDLPIIESWFDAIEQLETKRAEMAATNSLQGASTSNSQASTSQPQALTTLSQASTSNSQASTSQPQALTPLSQASTSTEDSYEENFHPRTIAIITDVVNQHGDLRDKVLFLGAQILKASDEHIGIHREDLTDECAELLRQNLEERSPGVAPLITKERVEEAYQFHKTARRFADYYSQNAPADTDISKFVYNKITSAFRQCPSFGRIGSLTDFKDAFVAYLKEIDPSLERHKEELINQFLLSGGISTQPRRPDRLPSINSLMRSEFKIAESSPTTDFKVRVDGGDRYGARDDTLSKVQESLRQCNITNAENLSTEDQGKLASWISRDIGSDWRIQYFSPDGDAPTDGTVLGQGVVCYPITMDYGADWKENSGPQTPFGLFSAAAINIGEQHDRPSHDFNAYSRTDGHGRKTLDEGKYLEGMKGIVDRMLTAQEDNGVTDTVLFPFGMGAFLRNLSVGDSSYGDPEKMYRLRYKLASAFLEKLQEYPHLTPHLCLPVDFNGDRHSELNLNYSAFIEALKDINDSELDDRLILHINSDATAVAQSIANEKDETGEPKYKVGLWNGSNKNMVGHYWYDDGARLAIEENLFRRSTMAGIIACYLNRGMPRQGTPHPTNSARSNIATRIAALHRI